MEISVTIEFFISIPEMCGFLCRKCYASDKIN